MLNEEVILATLERIENSMLAMDWAWKNQDYPLLPHEYDPSDVRSDLRECYAEVVTLRELLEHAVALDKMDYEALAKMTHADTLEILHGALRQQCTLNVVMDERKLGKRILTNAIKHHQGEAEPEEEP